MQVRFLDRKILWKRAWQPTPVFLPGESHGQRSQAGCSPQGPTELDTIEATLYMNSIFFELTLEVHIKSVSDQEK